MKDYSDVLRTAPLHSALQKWAVEEGIDERALTRIYHMLDSIRSGRINHRNPQQRPICYIPELSAAAWHDPSRFEWVARLEGAAERVLAEYGAMRSAAKLAPHPDVRAVRQGSWKTVMLFNTGKRYVENCNLLPDTVRLIESIPYAADTSLVYISSLQPGTSLIPHCGPANIRLRCHFGLSIPPGCWIRVGDETRVWKAGKCLIFDESFEHEAHNPSKERRDVLIIDFWHPELTSVERRAAELIRAQLAAHGVFSEY